MTRKSARQASSTNQGIQARNVVAEVMAVGSKSRAIKRATGRTDAVALVQAITQFRRGLRSLELDSAALAVVEEDVKKLELSVQAEEPEAREVEGRLQNIADKLKMVGVVLTEAVALREPVQKMAELLNTSFKGLGLA